MTTSQAVTPMHSPTLNDHILLRLLSQMRHKKTLLAFMCTCRQLYTAGMRCLLRLRYQLTPANISAFYTFLLADTSRFAALRDLSFPGRLPPDQATMASDILRRAVNLTSLHITSFQNFSSDYSAISVTLESLRNLEELLIGYVYELSPQSILDGLQCPLKRIHVPFFSNMNPIATLSQSGFGSTLERVIGNFNDNGAQGDHSLPNVISLRETSLPCLRMSNLMAFPHLKILVLKQPWCPFNDIREDPQDPEAGSYAGFRRINIAFHAQHKSWDALAYLNTDVACLYALALPCRVTSLAIQKLNLSGSRTLAWFHASLASMRPTYLHIRRLLGRPARFAEVLACGTDGVRKLTMNLVITSEREQCRDGLDALFDALPPGLRVLDCGISVAWARGERRGKAGDIRLMNHPAAQFLRELDVEALVQRALQAAPDLMAVRLQFPPGKAGAPRRKHHWVREEGTSVGSLRGASAMEYKTAAAIDREVVDFLKADHYGHL